MTATTLAALAALLAAAPARTAAKPAPPPAFVVVLDPGHGGEKEGALSVDGRREKDITLQIARLLRKRLEKQGARVVLTRYGDDSVDLPRRAAIANAEEADLFVSIHLNSAPGGPGSPARGIETYFLSADATDAAASAVAARENADRVRGAGATDAIGGILEDLEDQANLAESSRLAQSIHGALVRGTRSPDRGVKQAPFHVLIGARMAAVLLELGFVSHPVEGKELARPARQEAIANAIAAGIAAWRKTAAGAGAGVTETGAGAGTGTASVASPR
ncbi:MAG TPA: N-acetylmuramoyl-L-alanine amidase [Anaeromyxobacteraceae bacterium]|nr:N-acetylmuramoyl-L-alanine amidase [Anaeromyxobacteraceae bacterium]